MDIQVGPDGQTEKGRWRKKSEKYENEKLPGQQDWSSADIFNE